MIKDIRTNSRPKLSPISIQYAAMKTEKNLETAINYVDPENTGILTFEMLGKYGFYRVLKRVFWVVRQKAIGGINVIKCSKWGTSFLL